ncbi:MAG: hypothetical protein JO000_08160 [Alphaproteobacteria bacterium]|nr:hypothetical protein [Alphaproteobacteria bacterium]
MLSLAATAAQAQQAGIALKSGESTELHSAYQVINCESVVIGEPQIEVLEGPPELTLEIKQAMVIPRRQKCAKAVRAGTVIATAKEVKEHSQVRLTYRIKYKTKGGDRQEAHVYDVSLFP